MHQALGSSKLEGEKKEVTKSWVAGCGVRWNNRCIHANERCSNCSKVAESASYAERVVVVTNACSRTNCAAPKKQCKRIKQRAEPPDSTIFGVWTANERDCRNWKSINSERTAEIQIDRSPVRVRNAATLWWCTLVEHSTMTFNSMESIRLP